MHKSEIKNSDKSSLVPGYIVERTAKKMKKIFARLLSAKGFSTTVDQWVVLEQLGQNDHISQLDLAKLTFKDAPTITRIIDLLVKKGFVERAMNSEDRRKFKIVMTESGRLETSKIAVVAKVFRAKIYKDLAVEEVNQMKHILDQVRLNLDSVL